MLAISRLRRKPWFTFLVLLALVLALSSSIAIHAFAGAAPSTKAHISLSVHIGPPTSQIKVTGSAFGASETVQITFASQLVGTITASSSGTFVTNIVVPQTALPGPDLIQATGQISKLSAQSAFLVRTNWSMDGFGARRTHFNPYENVINASNVSALTMDWQYLTQGTINATPVVADGIIFVASTDQNLYAIDAQAGTVKWTATIGQSPATPLVANGKVFIGDANGILHALDEKTGYQLWHYNTGGGIVSAPVIGNGLVFIGTLNRTLYAFHEQTGGMAWNVWNSNGFAAPVAFANGVIYLELESDILVALDARTGFEKWSNGGGGVAGFEVVVENNYVYAMATGSIYAFDALTGKLKWRILTSNPYASYSAAVANGVVYTSLGNDTLYAINGRTGQVLWTYAASPQSQIAPSPAIANGVVYFSSGGDLYALDAQQGTLKWNNTIDYGLTSPVIANGFVYVGTYKGYLDTLHLATSHS